MDGLKGGQCDSLGNTIASTFILWFISFCLVFHFSFKFCFVLLGKLHGRKADPDDQKMDGNRMHNVKFTKNRYMLKEKKHEYMSYIHTVFSEPNIKKLNAQCAFLKDLRARRVSHVFAFTCFQGHLNTMVSFLSTKSEATGSHMNGSLILQSTICIFKASSDYAVFTDINPGLPGVELTSTFISIFQLLFLLLTKQTKMKHSEVMTKDPPQKQKME